jgi:hypothetical protein
MLGDLNVQKAVIEALESAGLTAYDHIPQKAGMPYVCVGEDDAEPWDTDDSIGASVEVTLEFFSRYEGARELKEQMREAYDALHRKEDAITIAGYDVVQVSVLRSNVRREPDDRTRRGEMTVQVIVESTDDASE